MLGFGGVFVGKVLVVDDDFEDLTAMKSVLEANKFKVSIATNGAQAIDLSHGQDFDLFLIDVKMPTLSGYDLVRLLREKHNGSAKIIFVSIVPKKEVENSQVDGFVQKPFSPSDLVSEVKRVLGGKDGGKKSKK
jgi:DNA-binding response OmpR family regulator